MLLSGARRFGFVAARTEPLRDRSLRDPESLVPQHPEPDGDVEAVAQAGAESFEVVGPVGHAPSLELRPGS